MKSLQLRPSSRGALRSPGLDGQACLGLTLLLAVASGCGTRVEVSSVDGGATKMTTSPSRGCASDPGPVMGCANVAFGPVVSYPAGKGVHTVVIADLNGDGKLDLAVEDEVSFTVTVLLNQGNGVFAPGVPYSTSSKVGSYGLAAGDLNGDGAIDLVAGAVSGSYVSVLLNKGDGSFSPGVQSAVGISPISVALADLNGDGRLDIATANGVDSTLSVLLNQGGGTFAPRIDYGAGDSASAVAVVDVNRDGLPDLVSASDVISGVSVLVNAGKGTFGKSTDYGGSALVAVAVGDVNGDGWPDLAFTSTSDSITGVRLNACDGTFGDMESYVVPIDPESVAMADLNGDSLLDLVVASRNYAVSVLLNRGNGTFEPAAEHFVKYGATSVAVGDLNGDGKPDLAFVDGGFDTVSVLLNEGCTP